MVNKTVADIIELMDAIAPQDMAEQWDNVGLQVGRTDWPVRSVMIALDPAPEVVKAACDKQIGLLITHHPLIFQPLKNVDFITPVGRIIQLSGRHRLAVFTAHTNFDSAAGGLNDILSRKIGIEPLQDLVVPAMPGRHGIGRIGDLPEPYTLSGLAQHIRDLLAGVRVKFIGTPDLPVRRVAVCTGSGGGLMDVFLASGADVFITGDLRYHDARSAEWANVGLIDIGHFASEYLMVNALTEKLDAIFRKRNWDVTVEASDLEKDPFVTV